MATLNIKILPDKLYRKLRLRAKQRRRSVAQEVTVILEQALEQNERRSILELRGLGKEIWADEDAAKHVERERGTWD